MLPCKRVGIDVTWRCPCRCKTCFYLRDERFHSGVDVPLGEVKAKIDKARSGGLDHVVAVGYGEPAICPTMPEIVDYAHSLGMATSMITSGIAGLDRFKQFYDQGMDHLHISSHGLDDTLDNIMEVPGAFKKQAQLKTWMRSAGWRFRTNVTLQQVNYRELPDLAEYEIEQGDYHFVFLGFLPHYHWSQHVNEVAVHPAELRPYIEDAARLLGESGTLFTIRYHPFCHLSPEFWPYVVNARYVFFDNTEWNYELQAHDLEALWRASKACGDSVAIQGEPCSQCIARPHCGGWNRVYAAAFSGAGLKQIEEVPAAYADVWHKDGGLHDLNPATRIPSRIRMDGETE